MENTGVDGIRARLHHGGTGRGFAETGATPDAFLGAERRGAGAFRFSLGEHLNGAFGGTFGGAVAACALRVARDLAPDRVPASLDVRFLRGLRGSAEAQGTVLHEGRSLATVSVDINDERGRPAARATIGLVAPGALSSLDVGGASPPALDVARARRWQAPAGVSIPIVATLAPRVLGVGDWGVATVLAVPWREPVAGAEAVCLGADMCVGPPVAAACRGRWIPHPNPDLSLRFATEQPDRGELVAIGRLELVRAGVALVRVDVWRGGALAGVGVSCSLLLAQEVTDDRGKGD